MSCSKEFYKEIKLIKYLLTLVLCLTSFSLYADEWNSSDMQLEGVFILTELVDMSTTLDIKNHTNTYEANPALGDHPTDRRIITYFAGVTAVQLLIVNYL